jgi:hypothetical protein
LGDAVNFFDCCLTDRIKGHSDVIKTKIEKIKKTPSDCTYEEKGDFTFIEAKEL